MKNTFATLSFCLLFFCIALGQKKQVEQTKLLHDIIAEIENRTSYDQEKYPLGLFTKEYYKAEADFAKLKIKSLAPISPSQLSDTDQISLELLLFVLQDTIDKYTFEQYLNPLLSDSGFHLNLNHIANPLTNTKQVQKYLNKLKAIPTFVDQHITILKEGIKKGISQPKVIFNGYESTYETHIVENSTDSYFFTPFKKLPATLSKKQQDSIRTIGKDIITNTIVPQFKRIKSFFEDHYIPNTRADISIAKTTRGKEYYQNRINYYTTNTNYTANKIHDIGLSEVSRIKKQMQEIITSLNFEGDFSDFLIFLRTDEQFYAKTPKELLMIARDMAKRADEQLPRFFKTLPRKPYGVAPVPDALAPKYTVGRYIGTTPESTEPGYYWVNTYNLKSRALYSLPALTVHEAVPGHHLQLSLNSELGDSIPKFRKNLYLSAFGEGWGLYSEFLAEEMGMYTTPYELFGKLTYEMWRACRLVVDTGIHAKGWTRKQVIDYMVKNTALPLHEIENETDRYIAWPGQALSYKIGELKIRELRQLAEKQLGEKFDIRQFHEVILGQGIVSLSILEKRIKRYISETIKKD